MNKRGSIEIYTLTITILIMIIILFVIFLLNIQINSCISHIKSDLFYICQNAYLAVDIEELAYANYDINEEYMKSRIIELLILNHPNYNFEINEITYEYINKNVYIDLNILIKPVVLGNFIGDVKLNIKDDIKLKLMEVN